MTEWLDIVDDRDRVIGRDTRTLVHAGGHFHRSSHIVLFNKRGEVFVQLRSMSKDSGAGLWDTSAAGHVDSGESYLACAVRELHEELGIKVHDQELILIGKLPPDARTGLEFTQVYRVCSEQALVLQADEIDDGRWLMPDELAEWMARRGDQFTEGFKLIWSMLTERQALLLPDNSDGL
ncbi:MAG: NUDIX domain-containing protein [Granulosicoccus sp.]